jgi:hypothetical protein
MYTTTLSVEPEKKSGQKKKLDLKALAWSDVVNYFKSKRGGVL